MLLTFGLFETAADVHAATRELIRADFDSSNLWLVARDLQSDKGDQNDRRTTIAQVIVALDLAAAARHFDTTGLVVIPEEGTFLAAGWPALTLTRVATGSYGEQAGLCRILTGIGCTSDEAGFLDGRLKAGTLLLGIADGEEERLKAAHEILADHQAIHVGAATTSDDDWLHQNSEAAPKLEVDVTSDTVILDFSALMVTEQDNDDCDHDMIGRVLVDQHDDEIGVVSAIVVDLKETDDRRPKYIVVQNGGFLGVGRNEYVVPFEMIEHEPDTGYYRAKLNRDVLENAPAFDPEMPLSRREEQTICGYYGTSPYWDR